MWNHGFISVRPILPGLSLATIIHTAGGEAPIVHSVLFNSLPSASRKQTWLVIAVCVCARLRVGVWVCVGVYVCTHPHTPTHTSSYVSLSLTVGAVYE